MNCFLKPRANPQHVCCCVQNLKVHSQKIDSERRAFVHNQPPLPPPRPTDRQTDRETDRQTDTYLHTHTHAHSNTEIRTNSHTTVFLHRHTIHTHGHTHHTVVLLCSFTFTVHCEYSTHIHTHTRTQTQTHRGILLWSPNFYCSTVVLREHLEPPKPDQMRRTQPKKKLVTRLEMGISKATIERHNNKCDFLQ